MTILIPFEPLRMEDRKERGSVRRSTPRGRMRHEDAEVVEEVEESGRKSGREKKQGVRRKRPKKKKKKNHAKN